MVRLRLKKGSDLNNWSNQHYNIKTHARLWDCENRINKIILGPNVKHVKPVLNLSALCPPSAPKHFFHLLRQHLWPPVDSRPAIKGRTNLHSKVSIIGHCSIPTYLVCACESLSLSLSLRQREWKHVKTVAVSCCSRVHIRTPPVLPPFEDRSDTWGRHFMIWGMLRFWDPVRSFTSVQPSPSLTNLMKPCWSTVVILGSSRRFTSPHPAGLRLSQMSRNATYSFKLFWHILGGLWWVEGELRYFCHAFYLTQGMKWRQVALPKRSFCDWAGSSRNVEVTLGPSHQGRLSVLSTAGSQWS